MKRFRIISEFRILRLAFYRKVSLKMLNSVDNSSFSHLVTVYLETIDHLNLKLLIFVGILQV